jgi:hypothetical protein
MSNDDTNGHERTGFESHADRLLDDPAGRPTRLATDGGELLEAGDDGEILGGAPDDERPAECECAEFHHTSGLPCWPCYRDGFEAPADPEGNA